MFPNGRSHRQDDWYVVIEHICLRFGRCSWDMLRRWSMSFVVDTARCLDQALAWQCTRPKTAAGDEQCSRGSLSGAPRCQRSNEAEVVAHVVFLIRIERMTQHLGRFDHCVGWGRCYGFLLQ